MPLKWGVAPVLDIGHLGEEKERRREVKEEKIFYLITEKWRPNEWNSIVRWGKNWTLSQETRHYFETYSGLV